MKKTTLLILFLLSVCFYVFSQETDTTSVIFPLHGEPIKNCQIIEIGPYNYIKYVSDIDTIKIKAKSYIKDGEFYDLKDLIHISKTMETSNETLDSLRQLVYNGHNYLYYDKEYKKAVRAKKTGKILVLSGLGASAVGGGLFYIAGNIAKNNAFVFYSIPVYFFGSLLIIGGVSTALAGIIVYSVGYNKAENYTLCKERCTKSLMLGPTRNGIGLVFKF